MQDLPPCSEKWTVVESLGRTLEDIRPSACDSACARLLHVCIKNLRFPNLACFSPRPILICKMRILIQESCSCDDRMRTIALDANSTDEVSSILDKLQVVCRLNRLNEVFVIQFIQLAEHRPACIFRRILERPARTSLITVLSTVEGHY